jgi:hypothetical protein
MMFALTLRLHDLGFSYQQFSKGVYFDGHESEDVVEDRKAYLAELESCVIAVERPPLGGIRARQASTSRA